jgi:hypothetical protein
MHAVVAGRPTSAATQGGDGNESPFEKILARLERVRVRQPGQASARCPAHEDRSPSLSVRETSEGAVLIHCFGGCTAREIVGAVGLNLDDLFPPPARPAGAPNKTARALSASQALELLAAEVNVVVVTLLNTNITLLPNAGDRERLLVAASRIAYLRDEALA